MSIENNKFLIPDYIINIGKCKSYLENSKNIHLFLPCFKKLNKQCKNNNILNYIEFKVKKIKNTNIAIPNIYSLLNTIEKKELFIDIILNDKDCNLLSNEELDYIKEKLNGELANIPKLKKQEIKIEIIKKNNYSQHIDNLKVEFNNVNLNYSYNKKIFTINEYLKEVDKILLINTISKDEVLDNMKNIICEHTGNKDIDFNKMKFSHKQGTEKIKEYKNLEEVLKDASFNIDIMNKYYQMLQLTNIFKKNLSKKDFKEKLSNNIPTFRKRIISHFLYEAFLFNHLDSVLLLGEIEFYLKLQNGINLKKDIVFKQITINNDLAKSLLHNFNVRNLLSHGIIDDITLQKYSFIIFLIALKIFYSE